VKHHGVQLPDPFPEAFRATLQQLVGGASRIEGDRIDATRARRRQLAQSGVFTGHRPYVGGDDLRRIDWNAYARSGGLFVKLLEEEEPRASAVVLDTSATVLAGSPPRWTGMLRLAAIAGGLSLRHLDALRLVAGGTELRLTGARSLPQLLDRLRRLEPGAAESPRAVVERMLDGGNPGRVHWISHFAEPAALEPALRVLRRHAVRATGVLPLVPDDRDIVQRGWVMVTDPASGRRERVAVDAAMAQEMRRQLTLLARQQDIVFGRSGAQLVRFELPAETDHSLAAWKEAAWTFRR